MSLTKKSIFIVLLILLLDQVLKIWVKTHMTLFEQIPILGDRVVLHFVENNGMAFGLRLPGDYGKLILTLFRLVAAVIIGFYMRYLIRRNAHPGLILSLSMIMAGALGNIIDSAFYGMIFSGSSSATVATIFPEGGGYSSFLHGKVVDMFYFPVLRGSYPSWFPFRPGEPFIFFRPVFNIADTSITIAVVLILFNQKRYFHSLNTVLENESTPEEVTVTGTYSDDENKQTDFSA
ncbi:MAG: lipoprotein signal peptidase [Bacteroidota bacterium]